MLVMLMQAAGTDRMMKRVIFILLLIHFHFSYGQNNVCSGDPISVSTTGYESSAGYAQHYVIVDANDNILAQNTSGSFSSTDYGTAYLGLLSVYAVNTNDGNLMATANGNNWANFSAAVNATCANNIGPLQFNIINCQATIICSGNDITESTSGFTTTSGYQQLYVLVDTTTNAIISYNSIGTFTSSDYGANVGVFSIYALNTNDISLVNQLSSQSWSSIISNANATCADIIGPKYYQIDICCDLQVSTTIIDESCENENDGEISIDISGTSNYNISSNGTVVYNGIVQGNYNIQNLADGTYTIYITDNAFSNCDTTINCIISSGDPTYNTNVDTSICNGSSLTINGITYNSNNLTGTQILSSISSCDSVVNITVTENPLIFSAIDTSICITDSLLINGTIYDVNNPLGQEIYSSTNGCDSTVFINITFNQQPTVTSNFSDTTVCEDDTITIYGIGAVSYIWNNNILDSVPVIGPDEGTYVVTGTDSFNCSNTYQFTLNTEFCPREPYFLIVPNVFTPNGDGENDIFKPNGTSFEPKSMKIFNRWGQLIFEDYYGIGWDGRLPSGLKASDGTYLYRITIQPLTIPASEIEEFKGFLQLIDR
ncbi:MAG: gliding motility-associated C-terminal domain-containing protein [Bacteroidota bacterium]|nr:gliding motility-associated C-terminal domain-containing protein [Bacteroidota bacterium]